MKRFLQIVLALLIVTPTFSCTKNLLDDKPDKSLLVPESLSDFQALLDNFNTMNAVPALQTISSDDYFITDAGWLGLNTQAEKNSYLWLAQIYQNVSDPDWDVPYKQVFYANVVLDGLAKLRTDSLTQTNYNQIKGGSYFYRAYANYNLSQMFAVDYDPATAANALGIPVRLSSDVNIKSKRASLQQSYDQILTDLNNALPLLPVSSAIRTRPTKNAVYALLAKVYLSMKNYSLAESSASASLQLNSALLDYNTLDPTASHPFPAPLRAPSPEVIYYSTLNNYSFTVSPETFIDSNLYKSYDANDLRKTLFFIPGDNGYNFNGTYTGNRATFGGLANDEMYLIRAECEARLGELTAALKDLNDLMRLRYVSGTYTDFTTADSMAALSRILAERRKELVGRGTRFYDLKRLNKEATFAVSLTRTNNGQVYSLAANSNRYVFPIPDDEIAADGLTQNPR